MKFSIGNAIPRFLCCLILISAFCGMCAADAAPALELPNETVFKDTLENGLIILVKENPSSDLVAVNIKVAAGSSLEDEYLASGIAHFVEHMVFKGTKSRHVGEIEREIKSYGGLINGSSSHDITTFTVTVPARYLANALDVLKDMLLNSAFEAEELEKEREVILSEIRLNNDEPQTNLIRQLYRTSYLVHPYRYPPIGLEGRFKALRREDLISYYNTMYTPNRMVVSIVGDTNGAEALELARKMFADFRSPSYRPVLTEAEPPQIAQRAVRIEHPTTLAYLAVGFHSTSIYGRDLFALDVLSMILGRGDNSRLNQRLFKKDQTAYSVSSSNYTPRDPGLFVITAILDPANIDRAQQEISEEIERLKEEHVADNELEGAKRMVIGDYIFSRQTNEEQADDIASSAMLTGSPDFSRRYVEGVGAVSKEDVKRAAREYLNDENRTVVSLLPRGQKPQDRPSVPGPTRRSGTVAAETLSNGMRIVARENRATATISMTVAMLGGISAETEKTNGVSNLTARMLLKGTRSRKADEIQGAIESRGGDLSDFSGFNSFGVSLSILKDDLELGLEIIKDIMTQSVFPAEELEKERRRVLAAIKDEDDDIFARGSYLLRENLFGKTPYALRYLGSDASVRKISREDLLDFYRNYCVASNMVISVSGDVDTQAVIERLKRAFAGLAKAAAPGIAPSDLGTLSGIRTRTIEMEKEQSLELVGFVTTDIKNDDRYALDVIASVLSGSSGRLFSRERNALSLAYTLGVIQRFGKDTGYLAAYIATTKERLPQAKSALLDQLRKIQAEAVTDEELEMAKREIITARALKMQTNDFLAMESALDELYGLGYGALDTYDQKITSVTKDSLLSVAKKYLGLDSYAEAVITSP